MNAPNQIKTVCSIWLLSGIALLIWSTIEAWQISHDSYLGITSGAFKATLIVVSFGILCILGAIGLIFEKNWGRIIILSAASILLLYAAVYLLMGGFEDTGLIYAVIISGLSLLSVSTILILVRKKGI